MTMAPVISVVMCGVWKRGWIFDAHAGSRPSFAIAKKMRGCAIICTMIVDDSPAIAPSLTTNGITSSSDCHGVPAALMRAASTATAIGAGTPSC